MNPKSIRKKESGYHPLRKLSVIAEGLRYAILYDFSVTYKVVVSIVILIASFMLRQRVDFLMILLATGFALVTEIINSAIEELCDFVEERHNERIRIIKDVAAAAGGISIFIWIVVIANEITEIIRMQH